MYLILILSLFGHMLCAQQFVVKVYDYNNGLISGANNFTLQDSIGYYWICCYGGIVRFDGSAFKTFRNSEGLIHYNVLSMYERRRGNFIVCNQYSLLHFDGNRFKEIKTNLNKDIVFYAVQRLRNGKEVVVTNQTVLEFKNDSTLIPYLIHGNSIKNIFEYGNKVVAITMNNHLLVSESGALNQDIVLPASLSIERLSYVDSLPLLMSKSEAYSVKGKRIYAYKPNGFTKSQLVRSAYQDRNGRIWFTDAKNQLWLKTASAFQNLMLKYNIKEVLDPNYMEDDNGNMVITSVYGMSVFKESYCEEILMDEIDNSDFNYVVDLFGIDTLVCGVNKHGLLCISKGKKLIKPIEFTGLSLDEKTFRCDIFPMENKNEYILRIPNKGIFLFKHNSLRPYCSKEFDYQQLLRGYYDPEEKCYFAGGNGTLYRITASTIDSFSSSATRGLVINNIGKLPNGAILFTGTHEALFLFNKNRILSLTPQLKTKGKTFSTLINQNRIWVVVHGVELQEYEIKDTLLQFKKRITKEQGLIDANISKIVFDEDSNMWINSFSGIYYLNHHYDKNEVYSRKMYLHQGASNAPMINDILYNHGHLYAVAIGSVLDIDTKNALKLVKPHTTYFSAIRVSNIDLERLEANHIIKFKNGIYSLPTTYNSILFQCNSVYFGYDDAIQYQYKLDEEDDHWKNLSASNTIQYLNLTSGHYILHVRSLNKVNSKFITETSFEFEIQPPFWKSWWFRALLGLLSIAIIYWFIKRRDAIKEKESKIALKMSELKLTALQSQMNPHFLFNSLNSIQNYILQQKPIDAARYLSKFSKLMRRILDQSFNNLSPLHEIIETIEMYLELEAFRFKNEFTWEVIMDETIQQENYRLPPMIIQPFVENAIIHGLMPMEGIKQLTIHFYIKHECLFCIIDDNGVGRNLNKVDEKTHISRGQKLTTDMLLTMKEILNKNVTINYIDKKDDKQNSLGTIIQIIIPQ